MEYEWDESKSDKNLRERGFNFAYCTRIFEGVTLENRDSRRDNGEVRIQAIGCIDGRIFRVTYTDRDTEGGLVRRIISAHIADDRDRQRWLLFVKA